MFVTGNEPNPYVIGVPIEDPKLLFGRGKVFSFLTDNLAAGAKVILLHGQRRIGKSSVLRQIPNFVHREEFVFVLFDLQFKARLPLGQILAELAGVIADRFSLPLARDGLPSSEHLQKDPDAFTRDFLPRLYDTTGGKNLVLLLDEFDVLNDYRPDEAALSFFPYLERAVTSQGKLFAVPVIGRQPGDLPRLLSLFRAAPNMLIGRLDEADATRQITEPAKEVLDYRFEAVQGILALTSGHPYFTQLLCNVLFAELRDERRPTVTRGDVEAASAKAIERGEAGLAWFYDGLSVAERVVFSAVAEAQETQPDEWPSRPMGEALQAVFEAYGIVQTTPLLQAGGRLIEGGFLEKLERSNWLLWTEFRYKVAVELVRRWLLLRHPLKDARLELEQIDPEAQALYLQAVRSRQEGDLRTALVRYEQALTHNPNHFRALLERADALVEVEEYEGALDLYPRVYRVSPLQARDGYVQALLESGRALLRQANHQKAKERLAKVLELEPDNAAARELLERGLVAASPSLPRNPFVVGRVVSAAGFIGRENTVSIALHEIDSRGHMALYGEQGMGKTSLLWYLTSEKVRARFGDQDSQILVYVNSGQAAIPTFSPARFWRAVLTEFKEQRGRSLGALANRFLDAGDFSYPRLREFFEEVQGRKQALVLLFDDFDVALQAREGYTETDVLNFIEGLQGLAQPSSLNPFSVSFVIATREKPSELGPDWLRSRSSPWFLVFSHAGLKPFDETEAEQLVTKMPRQFAPGDGERSWLGLVAGGYPYLLQAALSTLFRLHAEGRGFNPSQATEELAAGLDPFFSSLWRGLPGDQQDLLTLLAVGNFARRMGGEGREAEIVRFFVLERQRELIRLEDRGLVARDDGGRLLPFRLISSLLEWWIVKEVESLRKEELERRINRLESFAFSSDQAEGLRDAFERIWRQKSAFRSVENWGKP